MKLLIASKTKEETSDFMKLYLCQMMRYKEKGRDSILSTSGKEITLSLIL